jgi:hypothetical protein
MCIKLYDIVKEVVVTYFKVLSQISLEGTEQNYKQLSLGIISAKTRTVYFMNSKAILLS